MLLSGAVQFLLLCFKSTANETKREELPSEAVDSTWKISDKSQYKETDPEEHLASLLNVESSPPLMNCKNSAACENYAIQLEDEVILI